MKSCVKSSYELNNQPPKYTIGLPSQNVKVGDVFSVEAEGQQITVKCEKGEAAESVAKKFNDIFERLGSSLKMEVK